MFFIKKFDNFSLFLHLIYKRDSLCIGDKVFRTACFFSEKNLVRPRGVEIPSPLDQISLTPNTKGFQLYFHPRAPPSWSKQAKRLIFGTLTESHFRDHLQVTGHREKFYIGFFAQIFLGVNIHVEKPGKNLAQKVNEKIFTVDPYLMGTGVPPTFWIFSFFDVWAFLGKKLWFKLFKKKSHSNLGSFWSCHQFLAHFHYLGFFKKLLNLKTQFSEKNKKFPRTLPRAEESFFFRFRNFPHTLGMWRCVENCET